MAGHSSRCFFSANSLVCMRLLSISFALLVTPGKAFKERFLLVLKDCPRSTLNQSLTLDGFTDSNVASSLPHSIDCY